MLFSAIVTALALTTPIGDTCSSAVSARPAGTDIVDTAIQAGSFRTLVAALKAAELVDALRGEGPFTVFAPTDAAFAALPEGTLANLLAPENKGTLQAILTYHVVPASLPSAKVMGAKYATTLNGQRIDIKASDDGVMVDGARVTQTDIRCSNGIIHVIDAVILPSTDDIVATAVKAGSFKTLTAAVKAAGLVEALQGKGPFTVFAPTDEAFAALPKGTLESLLKPESREQLAAILKYHVVSGRVYADAAAAGAKVATLQGSEIRTRKDEKGNVLVQGARVVRADIETSNGVIHVIDKVLLPE